MSGRKKREAHASCSDTSGVRLAERRPGQDRQPLVIESDLPRLDSVAGWERELLLPLVGQLVEALACDRQTEE